MTWLHRYDGCHASRWRRWRASRGALRTFHKVDGVPIAHAALSQPLVILQRMPREQQALALGQHAGQLHQPLLQLSNLQLHVPRKESELDMCI